MGTLYSRAFISIFVLLMMPLVPAAGAGHSKGRKPPKDCGSGRFIAKYWNNTSLSGTADAVRCQDAVNHDWGTRSPSKKIRSNNFSARWKGTFSFASGDHVFTTTSDDGISLFVDGRLVIDAWKDQAVTDHTAHVSLSAGDHVVKAEYYEATGVAVAKISWTQTASAPKDPVDEPPQEETSPAPGDGSHPWADAGPSGVTAPAGAIDIAPGTNNILNAINSYPTGTVFRLRSGTHYLTATATPRSGQQFWAESGGSVIVTRASGYTVNTAFGGSASNVTLAGLSIRGFGDGSRTATVHNTGPGWSIRHNDIGPNEGWGVKMGDATSFRKNVVHHNQILGLAGGGTDSVIEGNEIAFNNPNGAHDWYFEAGGSKFVGTTNLVVRGNWSHGNIGPGLWTDINNQYTLYENNLAEYNDGPGIFHEISCDAVIRGNTLVGNGRDHAGIWYGGVGILVSSSMNVEVHGNTLSANGGGIGLMNRADAGDPLTPRCERNLKNTYVHDNVIRMDKGVTGAVSNEDGDLPFTSWNNRFQNNTYYLDNMNAQRFEWQGLKTKDQWRALGHDTTGSFSQL